MVVKELAVAKLVARKINRYEATRFQLTVSKLIIMN